jgi:hypothetical protein
MILSRPAKLLDTERHRVRGPEPTRRGLPTATEGLTMPQSAQMHELLRKYLKERACDCETIHAQQRLYPHDGQVIDLTGKLFLGLEDTRWPDYRSPPARWPTHNELATTPESATRERFPLAIQGKSRDFLVRGGEVRGLLHHLAPWHVWKLHGDGDGMRIEAGGPYEIVGTRIDNVEDGFAPRGDARADFSIRDVYVTQVHDDAIENDEVRSGSLRDSFIQTHTFYSARGKSNPAAVFTVENCVVELILQPHQGGSDAEDLNTRAGYPFPDGLGCGVLWKMDWDEPANSGKVDVRDSVFLIPRQSTSSNRAMQWAPGVYKNVTLVWLGKGEYPWQAPAGVTITRDRAVFDQAKARFFERTRLK